MYTNKINGMKYIGQTTQPLKKRHYGHKCGKDSYIDRALNKYGEDNFSLEVLEDGITDRKKLNEKEKYYIKKYDTFNNGYNLTRGGEGADHFNAKDAALIIGLLKITDLTMEEIGYYTGYSIYTISSINTGNTCRIKSEQYPIRENRCTQKYFRKDAESVIVLLLNTTYSAKKIAELTNTTIHFVHDVNRGKCNYADYRDLKIPIRPSKAMRPNVTIELAKTVVDLLKQKDKSAKEISEIVKLPSYTIGQINRGKLKVCKLLDESFPIRPPYRNKESAQQTCAKLTIEQINEIVDLILNTSCSFEEIARRFDVNKTTIDRINRKQTWKNVLEKYEAPIRTNPYNKQFSISNE